MPLERVKADPFHTPYPIIIIIIIIICGGGSGSSCSGGE